MMPTAAATLAALLTAIPAIDSITVARSGSDLVLSWPAVAAAIDGYRVYRSDEETCSAVVTACDTPATTCTVAAAFDSPAPALFRVAAYDAVEEAPLSPPAYKFAIPLAAGRVSGTLVAPGYSTSSPGAFDFCTDLNGAVKVPYPVFVVNHLVTGVDRVRTQSCSGSFETFTCPAGRSFLLKPPGSGYTVIVAGGGDRAWLEDFAETATRPTPELYGGVYWVALPFDHAYADLAAVATELPEAILVSSYDGASVDPLEGLERYSPSEPWGGSNRALGGRRGEGLAIGVATPRTWSPRRLCGTGLGMLPGRLALLAAKAGDDVALSWVGDAFAVGGYSVYRVDERPALVALAATSARLSTPGPAPAFPLLDLAAVSDPTPLLFYQVAGKASDGALGGF